MFKNNRFFKGVSVIVSILFVINNISFAAPDITQNLQKESTLREMSAVHDGQTVAGLRTRLVIRPRTRLVLPAPSRKEGSNASRGKPSSAGNVGILLDPGRLIELGITGDKAVNYRVRYQPTRTADEARALLKKVGALIYDGPLRGLDFGSSQDLQELKELLTPAQAKKLDEIAATTIFASKFRGSLKIEALPDKDKDKIIYVARIHGLTEEKPRVFTEKVRLVKDEKGNPVVPGGQADAIGYILWNLFGITGVKVTYELSYPGDTRPGIERVPQAGGMGTSGNTNVGLLLIGSILSGAGLSIADCVAEATILENTVFQGFTGGQEAYSTVLGKAYKAIWPGGIMDKGRNLQHHPYSAFAVPVCETDEDLKFVEDRTVLVQPGVRYEKIADDKIEKMAHRSASSINTQWMKLAELKEDGTPLDPVGVSFHQNKIQHGNNQAQGAINKDMELINRGNLGYVKERDKLCLRWMELILQGDKDAGFEKPQTQWLEKLSISDRIGLATYVPKSQGKGLLTSEQAHQIAEGLEPILKKSKEDQEVTTQDYAKLKKYVIANLKALYANDISLYSDYAKELTDAIKEVNKKAKKLVMSAIPLGAGGDGGIVAVFCTEGKEYLEQFLAKLGLHQFNPAEVEKVVTKEGGTLKGWWPYEIARKGLSLKFERNARLAAKEGFVIPELPRLSVYDEVTATYAKVKSSSAGAFEALNKEILAAQDILLKAELNELNEGHISQTQEKLNEISAKIQVELRTKLTDPETETLFSMIRAQEKILEYIMIAAAAARVGSDGQIIFDPLIISDDRQRLAVVRQLKRVKAALEGSMSSKDKVSTQVCLLEDILSGKVNLARNAILISNKQKLDGAKLLKINGGINEENSLFIVPYLVALARGLLSINSNNYSKLIHNIDRLYLKITQQPLDEAVKEGLRNGTCNVVEFVVSILPGVEGVDKDYIERLQRQAWAALIAA